MKGFIFFLFPIIFCRCSDDGPKKKDKKELPAVVSVEVNGTSGDYTFSVGVLSPDLGCEQYADWIGTHPATAARCGQCSFWTTI